VNETSVVKQNQDNVDLSIGNYQADIKKIKEFRRIYDSQMRKEVHLATMVETIRVLHRIVKNIVDHDLNEEKYRKLPANSKVLNGKIIQKRGKKVVLFHS